MRPLSHIWVGLLPAALPFVLALTMPAAAQEDSFRQEWENLKDQVGFGVDRPPIDFSERPPLAVPPTNTLPPPVDSMRTSVVDPDEMARRKALSDSRRPVPPTDPGAAAGGRSARAYLIDPPSGLRDPAVVSAGIETDGTPGSAVKTPRHHTKRTPAPQ